MTKNNILYFILFIVIVSVSSCSISVEKVVVDDKLKVGVFNGNGASTVCILETIEALKIDSGIHPIGISAAQIMAGELDGFDVLVFPGGSGSKEFNNLGLQAAEKVKEFANQNNKGLVGICAGG